MMSQQEEIQHIRTEFKRITGEDISVYADSNKSGPDLSIKASIAFCKGFLYQEEKKYEEMLEQYKIALENGAGHETMFHLAIYYKDMKNDIGYEKYSLLASKNGCTKSMHNLGLHYHNKKNYGEMIKHYNMAIEHGDDENSMWNMFIYYRDAGDAKNLYKYLKMVTKKYFETHGKLFDCSSLFDDIDWKITPNVLRNFQDNKPISIEEFDYNHNCYRDYVVFCNNLLLNNKQ